MNTPTRQDDDARAIFSLLKARLATYQRAQLSEHQRRRGVAQAFSLILQQLREEARPVFDFAQQMLASLGGTFTLADVVLELPYFGTLDRAPPPQRDASPAQQRPQQQQQPQQQPQQPQQQPAAPDSTLDLSARIRDIFEKVANNPLLDIVEDAVQRSVDRAVGSAKLELQNEYEANLALAEEAIKERIRQFEAKYEARLSSQEEALAELGYDAEAMQSALQKSGVVISQLADDFGSLKTDQGALRERLDAIDGDLSKVESLQEELQQEGGKLDEKALQELRLKVEELEDDTAREVGQLSSELDNVDKDLRRLRERLETEVAEKVASAMQDQQGELRREIQDIMSRLQEVDRDAASSEALVARIDGLQREFNALKLRGEIAESGLWPAFIKDESANPQPQSDAERLTRLLGTYVRRLPDLEVEDPTLRRQVEQERNALLQLLERGEYEVADVWGRYKSLRATIAAANEKVSASRGDEPSATEDESAIGVRLRSLQRIGERWVRHRDSHPPEQHVMHEWLDQRRAVGAGGARGGTRAEDGAPILERFKAVVLQPAIQGAADVAVSEINLTRRTQNAGQPRAYTRPLTFAQLVGSPDTAAPFAKYAALVLQRSHARAASEVTRYSGRTARPLLIERSGATRYQLQAEQATYHAALHFFLHVRAQAAGGPPLLQYRPPALPPPGHLHAERAARKRARLTYELPL